tara:strand:- start:841 stop:2100 length:1260 start_codon:yes stop_codon:yes gene_type:complete
MIRILHLSYCDRNTGAGIAAKRIHNCIREYNDPNIKSLLRVNTNGDDNKNIIHTKRSLSRFYNFFKKYFERIIINIFKYEDNIFHSISAFPSLKHHEINKLNIDLVHIHWVQHETISIEEIGKIKFPIIWTLHDCWPFSSTEHYQKDILDKRYKNGYKIKKIFKISEYVDKFCFFRKKLSWINHISLIAPSKWIGDCAKNSLLMRDKQIVIIPNPLNTKVFRQINKNKAKKLLKLNTKKKVILFGSIDGGKDPRKGADLLIDILNFLTLKKDNIQIVIFGKKNKYQDIFKNTNFEIINLGKINSNNKMSTIYSAADIFIIPSRIESFGQTAAEAQSCGTPVAGFDIGGLKDIITNNKNGILIEPYNSKKMALAIENLLNSEDKISKFSKASRENAILNWNYQKVAKSHIKFYKNILNYE